MLMDHRRIPEAEVALQKAIDQPLKNTNTENRSHGHKLTETYDMMTNIKLLQKKFDEDPGDQAADMSTATSSLRCNLPPKFTKFS
eukprot:Awhi_evm1s9496